MNCKIRERRENIDVMEEFGYFPSGAFILRLDIQSASSGIGISVCAWVSEREFLGLSFLLVSLSKGYQKKRQLSQLQYLITFISLHKATHVNF